MTANAASAKPPLPLKTTTSEKPTDEQLHILDLAKGETNLMINALAGCGKTTTLEMIESVQPAKPVLYLAFNKKIADDATKRMASTTQVRTFNALGHRIWAKACAKNLSLDPKKIQNILREVISGIPRGDRQSQVWKMFWEVVSGVNVARTIGYIPDSHAMHHKRLADADDLIEAMDEVPEDNVLDMIDSILTKSIFAAYQGLLDFGDQVYMPTLFGGNFPQFPLVMVDEYQDLNPLNHHMIHRLAKQRLIGVGDPYQNIYGFRGAKAQGMADAVTAFAMTECDLSVSFRCPERIVRNVHWRVPHFKWIKPGGSVAALPELYASVIPDDSTVICRNNAPLFRLAMRLLASGRSVAVAGSDVGPKVIAQMKRLGPETMQQEALIEAIDSWLLEKLAKGSKTAQDTADCMTVFASHGQTLSQAIAYAKHLFEQQGSIRFTTGHKAKGLEWNTVYHLDPWLIGDDEQELNLRYVISTRSADKLREINSSDIRFST